MSNTLTPVKTKNCLRNNSEYDSVPLYVKFMDKITRQRCLMLEEPEGLNLYQFHDKAWYYWRPATLTEAKEILAATGED